ncbi:Arm DNA-binding domain-containing protein [Comamonas aquatica]|uniref:Arm DNA-binding domain-containing protein n=1 Tax=Comamonas aquatica TaxID=225991 RepID=UPI003C79A00F
MPLTDTKLKALKPRDKSYQEADEGGLFVEVLPSGQKTWRLRYRMGGRGAKQEKVTLGEYTHRYGPDIALDGASPERVDYRQVLLPFRLREAIARLNPGVPVAAREDGHLLRVSLGQAAAERRRPASHRRRSR